MNGVMASTGKMSFRRGLQLGTALNRPDVSRLTGRESTQQVVPRVSDCPID